MRALKAIAAGAAGASALAYAAYRRDLQSAIRRIENERQTIETPEGFIEFAESGDGPAALIIHGAGGGFDQGLAVGAAFLGDGYRLIAPSRFGYLGTPLRADASPAAQADAHVRVLDALRIDSVPVIGVSAGGPSAMQLCLRHRERCAALVLVVPLAWVPERGTGDARLAPWFQPVLDAVAASDFLYWTAMHVARSTLVETLLGTPRSVYRNATSEERRNIDGMLRSILPIRRRVAGIRNDSEVASNLTDVPLEELRVPTLVISAADDRYDTYDSGLHTAERIRDARFTGFPTGGHLLLGHEVAVRSEIATFLQEHLGARAAAVAV